MKKILLDTNAYSEFCRGNIKVLEEIISADIIYFSVIVKAELITGFIRGSREKYNREILNKFLAKPTITIHEITEDTVEYFAQIKTCLVKSGNPIPINDVWIAAESLETKSTLITFDNHFRFIPDLDLSIL